MNGTRRKQIRQALDLLEQARNILNQCMEEEQDYVDSMPENLQNSDRYYAAEESISNLEDAIDNIDEAVSNAEEAAGM